jgi:hypothetical protein
LRLAIIPIFVITNYPFSLPVIAVRQTSQDNGKSLKTGILYVLGFTITKRGDAYLRTLLILGARSVIHTAALHTDRMSRWVANIESRRGYQRTLVAIANKNARIAWALLSKNEELRLA